MKQFLYNAGLEFKNAHRIFLICIPMFLIGLLGELRVFRSTLWQETAEFCYYTQEEGWQLKPEISQAEVSRQVEIAIDQALRNSVSVESLVMIPITMLVAGLITVGKDYFFNNWHVTTRRIPGFRAQSTIIKLGFIMVPGASYIVARIIATLGQSIKLSEVLIEKRLKYSHFIWNLFKPSEALNTVIFILLCAIVILTVLMVAGNMKWRNIMLEMKIKNQLGNEGRTIEKVEIKKGEIIALLGENGSGKSTFIKQIFGLRAFVKNEVLLDGEEIGRNNIHRLSLGSHEHTFYSEFTVAEQKEFYRMNFPDFKEDRFELLVEYFKLPMNRKMKRMSAGEQNQVETVFALCQGADYIFLDEPFANNDIFRRKDFYKLIMGMLEENECLVIVTHLVDEISNLVSRVILMDKLNVVGDVTIEELDEQGLDVVEWLKTKLYYNEERATDLIKKMEGR